MKIGRFLLHLALWRNPNSLPHMMPSTIELVKGGRFGTAAFENTKSEVAFILKWIPELLGYENRISIAIKSQRRKYGLRP